MAKLEKPKNPEKLFTENKNCNRPVDIQKMDKFMDWWQNTVHGNNFTQAQYERVMQRL